MYGYLYFINNLLNVSFSAIFNNLIASLACGHDFAL